MDPVLQRMQQQVPDTVSLEQIHAALETCKGDELEALCLLLNVAPPRKEVTSKNAQQQKWDEIREICDAYDDELDKAIKSQKVLKE